MGRETESESGSIVVAQLGARMHYAVPRILDEAEMLERVYTDICVDRGIGKWLARIFPESSSGPLRRLQGRRLGLKSRRKIRQFDLFGLRYALKRYSARSEADQLRARIWAGKELGRLVNKSPLEHPVYAFNGAALEIFEGAKRYGVPCILEQTIAPREVEESLLRGERRKYPQWDTSDSLHPAVVTDFCNREKSEWELADLILCASDFVRTGILSTSSPAAAIEVAEYGIESAFQCPKRSRERQGPLRVLTVGEVGLRKGSPYVLESAKTLGTTAQFRMVGPISVPQTVEKDIQRHLELIGQVPRLDIAQHFCWADVFLLPSLCEGSATVCYEALMAGLPVVTTENSGSIVRHGKEGFIVPTCSTSSIVETLERLADDRQLLENMSGNAIERSQYGSFQAYGDRLLALLARFAD